MTAQPVTTAAEPTKPQGKARCRIHAFRHGVTGQVFVFSPAETDAYRNHCAAIQQHYQPSGPVETFLTDQIANGMWRIQRAAAIEQGLITIDEAGRDESEVGPAYAWLEQQKAFRLLITYEGRLRRALEKDKAELQALQSARKEAAAEAMNQAVALHKLAKAEGKPYNPAQYFRTPPPVRESVFSEELVAAESARRETLARLNRKAA